MTPTGAQAASPASAAAPLDWRALPDLEPLRPALWRLAYRFCWNAADADDAVQDALLRAAERHCQLTSADKLTAWLRAIVVRRCQELRRDAARRRTRETGQRPTPRRLADTTADPAQATESAELGAVLEAALQRLPERQQTAVVLRHLEGLEYEEIADIMAITASTVRVHVRDAREALRKLLFEA